MHEITMVVPNVMNVFVHNHNTDYKHPNPNVWIVHDNCFSLLIPNTVNLFIELYSTKDIITITLMSQHLMSQNYHTQYNYIINSLTNRNNESNQHQVYHKCYYRSMSPFRSFYWMRHILYKVYVLCTPLI